MNRKIYLTELFDKYKPNYSDNKFDLIVTPCGSGKTHYVLSTLINHLDEQIKLFKSQKVLVLTDTSNLREQNIKDCNNDDDITSHLLQDLIYIKTYAWFGYQLQNKDTTKKLFEQFDYFIFDECHQLSVYSDKYDDDTELYGKIIDTIPRLATQKKIIGLTATPYKFIKCLEERDIEWCVNDVIYDVEQTYNIKVNDIIMQHKTENTYTYSNLETLIRNLSIPESEKVLIYVSTIKEMRYYEELLKELNHSGAVVLWSPNAHKKNSNNKLSVEQEEQLTKLFETGEYDSNTIIINDSMESGINIENCKESKQQTQTVIVNSSASDKITQIRGRIRHDVRDLFHLQSVSLNYGNRFEEELSRLNNILSDAYENNYRATGKDKTTEFAELLNIRDNKRRILKTPRAINEYLNDNFYDEPSDVDLIPYRITTEKIGGKNYWFVYKI